MKPTRWKEEISNHDAKMAKKLQKVEKEHDEELADLRAQAQMSQQSNTPAVGSSLGSVIIPMVMFAVLAGGMGTMGGLGI